MSALLPCLIFKRFIQFTADIYLNYDSEIGPGFCIVHKGGVRVVSGVRMGENVTINCQVTIGRSMLGRHDAPIIGNNVHISIGARILGNVSIGDNVLIGANAVVLDDIPPNGIAVGVPARFIPKDTREMLV